MAGPSINVEGLRAILHAEIEKLIRSCPSHGELSLSATIHDYDIGKIVLGIATARKISVRPTGGAL